MNTVKFASLGISALGLMFAVPTFAQVDSFNFIPLGGKTLLESIIKSGTYAEFATGLLSSPKQTSDAWADALKQKSREIPAIGTLDDRQLKTLASYLQHNLPLDTLQLPKDAKIADWPKILPEDGRDLILKHCQSCHIITVVVTQDRTREAWLGTMNKPSHVEIGTTPVQREEIADYLVQNAAIPIDLVPEELRAGGATY